MGADQISDSSRQTTFHLINIAPDACEMAGAPTIKFLDHTDAVVPWPVSLTGPAATPNVVPPSGFAEFTITQTGSDCEPQTAAASITEAQIYPPGQHDALRIPHTITICSPVTVTATALGGAVCESDIEVATATTVTSLDDCEGALTTTTAIVIDPGQQIRLTYPAALRSAILTTNTATIISITGLTITALSPGAATVTQTGWPCSNDTTRCPVLTITVR